MRLRNVAKLSLFIAAIALVSLKGVMMIGSEASFPTILSPPDQSAVLAETTTLVDDPDNVVQTQQALQTAATAPADCVPCNQAAAQQEGCPDHCECLTKEDADELGLTLCNNEEVDCWVSSGFAAAPKPGYCYQTAEEATCPDHCVCLPVVDGEAAGYSLCDGMVMECALDTRAEHRCYEVQCPDGCVCVTQAVAKARGYPGLCGGVQTLCGYDVDGTPQYCYTERAEDEPVVCREDDFTLRQVRLDSGHIRFIVDVSCPIARVEIMIDGTVVKECAGRYCEYTGGPYPLRATPDFSAVLFDHLDEEAGRPAFTPQEIVVTMPDDVSIIDFDPCPLCPDPEPEWGECLSHTCDGNDHFQAYDWTSNVQLTGCIYENYALTGGVIGFGGEVFDVVFADPFFDYCIDDRDIVLHRCRNNFISRHTHTCPYGCYAGACVCATSDGGIDFYKRGGVRYGTDYYVPGAVDYCIDEKTLREFYTEIDHENNTCTIKWIDFECPGECRDGACHGTCFDGIQNQGELGIDCGGPCLAACEYDLGWYPQNYGFKFENPPGRELSLGTCWSRSSSCSTGYGHYKGTFGNCSVCICNWLLRCCTGWHIHAGLFYPIYRYGGAPAGQCTGMSLSSLAFYYGDRTVEEYDPWAEEVIHLEREGDLKRHIASRQGKIVSAQNIKHYLTASSYRGANSVLAKVEAALSKDPPEYGMIMVIEDNGWGETDEGAKFRRKALGHTVVATYVEHMGDEIYRIYVYDSNIPVAENPTPDCPYFNADRSPYIEIDKERGHYTFYDDPDDPITDSDGQLWSNANNELFDRIIYVPYSILGGNVDIPMAWDVAIIAILSVMGSVDAQVEDDAGNILGFSEDGPDAPTIEDAMIFPIFGEPYPEAPTIFALPAGDYKISIRGHGTDTYGAYILGDSPHAFAISDVAVSEGTRDTISVQYGAHGEAVMSFTTQGMTQGPVEITSIYVDEVTEISYRVVSSTISYGSEVSFSVDPRSRSLVFTNYGDTPVTYSAQIYKATIPQDGETNSDKADTETYVGAFTATTYGSDEQQTGDGDAEGDLAALIEGIQITEVYTFTVEPMERHIVAPEDWSDLPGSEIRVTRESVATTRWTLIAGIIGAAAAIAVAGAALLSQRRGASAKTSQ